MENQKSKSILKRINPKLTGVAWYELPLHQVEYKLATSFKDGLSNSEVLRRLEAYGKNQLPEEESDGYISILIRQIRSPLVYILLFAAFVSLALQHYSDLAIILVAVFINVLVGLVQERRASETLVELKKIIKPNARVIREGGVHEVPAAELVPGDIILLRPGDRVPADGRVIDAENLEVVEAELTGESVASLKHAEVISHDAPLPDQDNMVFMGTVAASGKAQAVVVATNLNTELGRIAQLLITTEKQPTPLQHSLMTFSRLVAGVTLGLSFGLLIIGILRHQSFFDMLVTAVAVAVAVIPEGLLISLTVILAIGMQRILKARGLVRHLAAAETLGATSVICTDKTGTLTVGEMRVAKLVSASEEIEMQSQPSELKRSELFSQMLKIGVMVNEALIENPGKLPSDWKVIGDPVDRAFVLAAAEIGFFKSEMDRQYEILDEIAFDSRNKFSACLRLSGGHIVLYAKGAAEIILRLSDRIGDGEQQKTLTSAMRKTLEQKIDAMTGQGLRVLALAYRRLDKPVKLAGNLAAVSNLTFAGLVGLRDPLRPEVQKTIEQAKNAGLRPILVTGDHRLTAQAVAQEAGLEVQPNGVVVGEELEKMDEAELIRRAPGVAVYARVTPTHKLRIIDAWQKLGAVVAMTGDGVNDAPALKKADIGMSLGSGTEVAKQASDLVLLDNNFSTIVAAIEQGRVIFNNIRRVIVYLLSDSFSQLILIAGALLLNLPIPLLPAQILWINLITDGFPNLALTMEPGDASVMRAKPRPRNEPLINSDMKISILFVGLLTDLVFLFVFVTFFNSFTINVMRTLLFAAFGFSSLIYVSSLKSFRLPLWRINPLNNPWLLLAILGGLVIHAVALQTPFLQELLGVVPLPFQLWWVVIGLSIVKLVVFEFTKYGFRLRDRH